MLGIPNQWNDGLISPKLTAGMFQLLLFVLCKTCPGVQQNSMKNLWDKLEGMLDCSEKSHFLRPQGALSSADLRCSLAVHFAGCTDELPPHPTKNFVAAVTQCRVIPSPSIWPAMQSCLQVQLVTGKTMHSKPVKCQGKHQNTIPQKWRQECSSLSCSSIHVSACNKTPRSIFWISSRECSSQCSFADTFFSRYLDSNAKLLASAVCWGKSWGFRTSETTVLFPQNWRQECSSFCCSSFAKHVTA